MATEISRNHPVHISSDRNFGFTFALFFLVLTLLSLHQKERLLGCLLISLGFFICALVHAALLHPLNLAWFRFGEFLFLLVSPLVLATLFFAVVTPVGFLKRVFGEKSIDTRFSREADSYWLENRRQVTVESLVHQF